MVIFSQVTFMSMRALSVMENLSDRLSPRVCFPFVKMFHATFKQQHDIQQNDHAESPYKIVFGVATKV